MSTAMKLPGAFFLMLTLAACSGAQDAGQAPEAQATGAESTDASKQMVIAVFGASGNIGSDIAEEALARGHRVIGISRNPDQMSIDNPLFTPAQGDVTDPASFRDLVKDADAVVISVSGNMGGNAPEQATTVAAAKTAIDVLSRMEDAPYVLQIGGATTLYPTQEEMVKHFPFPAEEGSPAWGMFFGHMIALETYRKSNIAWTVLTPALTIQGDWPRTGSYREATTGPIFDDSGESQISRLDLAVAAVDELERRKYSGERFTVGY